MIAAQLALFSLISPPVHMASKPAAAAGAACIRHPRRGTTAYAYDVKLEDVTARDLQYDICSTIWSPTAGAGASRHQL